MHESGSKNEDMFKSINEKIIDSANLFFRSLILINGGFAVSMSALATNLLSHDDTNLGLLNSLSQAMFTSAIGVALGALSIMLGYFTNYFIADGWSQKANYSGSERIGGAFYIVTFLASVASLCCFVFSAYIASIAFQEI